MDRPEVAAHGVRAVGLHIEGFVLRRPAVSQDHDARLDRARPGARFGSQQLRQRQTERPQGARMQ
jgi:hypothetical protein